MEIGFTKRAEGDHIISCKRKDGTSTWMHSSSFFVQHDLCHYAVETTLGMKHAFYGMLAQGVHISDFELPKEQRNFELTDEALIAEHLVNLLMIDQNQGMMENVIEQFKVSYKMEIIPEYVTEQNISIIRSDFAELMQQWRRLNKDESLLLEFEE